MKPKQFANASSSSYLPSHQVAYVVEEFVLTEHLEYPRLAIDSRDAEGYRVDEPNEEDCDGEVLERRRDEGIH